MAHVSAQEARVSLQCHPQLLLEGFLFSVDIDGPLTHNNDFTKKKGLGSFNSLVFN